MALPLLTAALPGTGGRPIEPEDFRVEEIPAYLPAGEGEHCYALVRKRELTTPQAIERICRKLGLDRRNAGYAGLKDKHAVTEQWLSFFGADPAALEALSDEAISVLDVRRHRNKLRTGHLRGNRFVITLRGVCAGARDRAEAILAAIATVGLPNAFGPQRFGLVGDNAERGLQILRGESRPPRDKRLLRLLLSALQSQLFNDVLAERIVDEQLRRLVGGEVLRLASGGIFVSEDQQEDQRRVDAGELTITGPICGPKMVRPLAGSAAAVREDAIFAGRNVGPGAFSKFSKIARGARRALLVPLDDWRVETVDEDAIRLSFALPAGAYATVLLREVTKP